MSRISDIDDYVSGALPEADVDRFEGDLFAAAAEGGVAELRFLDALARITRWFAVRGGFTEAHTHDKIAELRSHPHVHYLEIEPGTRGEVPEWPKDTELVVYRIGVDLRGCTDIDVALFTSSGEHVHTFRDVQYDPKDGAIYSSCDEPLARTTFRAMPFFARVEAVRGSEGKTTVATFTITPT